MAFGLLNAAWAAGAMVGPAVAGAIAALTGDAVPFLLVAGAAVAVFVFLGRSKEIRPQPGTVFR
jgi:MFS family permease